MANKPLKSIKFPGLSDTYTVPEVDDTLAVTGAAADAKKVGDEISDIKADLSDITGLSEEAKTALLACFTRVAWIGDDGQDYYDALEEALNRTKEITSISAVFTQGSAVIYDTDELSTLKQYLTVTATYSDSTTKAVSGYSLTGTLTVGTSTITVTYGGKTATFNVTVTEHATPSEVLYSLPSAKTFNGTSDYIDTGLQLMKSGHGNYTIVMDILNDLENMNVSNITIMHCMNERSPYPGICIQTMTGMYINVDINSTTKSASLGIGTISKSSRAKLVIICDFEAKKYKALALVDQISYTEERTLASDINSVDLTQTALIGCYQTTSGGKGRYWKGTMYDFKIYGHAFTDAEANAYLQEDHS